MFHGCLRDLKWHRASEGSFFRREHCCGTGEMTPRNPIIKSEYLAAPVLIAAAIGMLAIIAMLVFTRF